jgi:hypothetical protein
LVGSVWYVGWECRIGGTGRSGSLPSFGHPANLRPDLLPGAGAFPLREPQLWGRDPAAADDPYSFVAHRHNPRSVHLGPPHGPTCKDGSAPSITARGTAPRPARPDLSSYPPMQSARACPLSASPARTAARTAPPNRRTGRGAGGERAGEREEYGEHTLPRPCCRSTKGSGADDGPAGAPTLPMRRSSGSRSTRKDVRRHRRPTAIGSARRPEFDSVRAAACPGYQGERK